MTELRNIAGIDGCRAGWICVFEQLPSRSLASKIFTTIDELAKHAAELDAVAIDIPIGLTDAGPRACDVDARKLLRGKRASSVFPAPIRPALGAETYPEACARSLAAHGKRLSKQGWAIYPKIRELDELLRGDRALCGKLIEVHPEVTFCAWNAMSPIDAPKKSAAGAAIRKELIAAHFGAFAFDTVRARYKKRDVADDDICDAFAALWTAERIVAGNAKALPAESAFDSERLPMRIVY